VFFVSSIDGGGRKSKGFSNRAVHGAQQLGRRLPIRELLPP